MNIEVYRQFPDNKLIILLRDDFFDNRTVFDYIYSKYVNKLYRYVHSIIKSRQNCDEIIVEIFTALWDKRNSLSKITSSKITSISEYLNDAAKFCVVRYIKNHSKEYQEHYTFFEVIYDDLGREANSKFDFKTSLLKRIRLLPAKFQKVVLLRLQYLRSQEIAEKMNISNITVNNYIIIALAHIKSVRSSCW